MQWKKTVSGKGSGFVEKLYRNSTVWVRTSWGWRAGEAASQKLRNHRSKQITVLVWKLKVMEGIEVPERFNGTQSTKTQVWKLSRQIIKLGNIEKIKYYPPTDEAKGVRTQLTVWNSPWCQLSSGGFTNPAKILGLSCLISCAPLDKESHSSILRLGLPSYTLKQNQTKPLSVSLSLFHMKHKTSHYCWKCRNALLPNFFFTDLWHMKSGICGTKPNVAKIVSFFYDWHCTWITTSLPQNFSNRYDHAGRHVTALKLFFFIFYFAYGYGIPLKL